MEHMTSSSQRPQVPVHSRPIDEIKIRNGVELGNIWLRYSPAARDCQSQIHLRLLKLKFCCFHKLVSTVSLFPTTTDLDVTYCTWGIQQCTECARLPPYPSAPRFLSKLFVQVDASVSPVRLAEFLVSGYDRRRSEIAQWTFDFRVKPDRNRYPGIADEFSRTLRTLGSTVTDLDIVPYCHRSDSRSRISHVLDLSHNTRLESVDFQNIVPGYCPRDLIRDALSTISLRTRPYIEVRFQLDYVDDNVRWDTIDFKALYDFVSMHEVTLGLSVSVADPRFRGTLDLSRYTAFRTAIVTALGSEEEYRKFERRLEFV